VTVARLLMQFESSIQMLSWERNLTKGSSNMSELHMITVGIVLFVS
jgi:hypothetical protein